MCAVKRNLTKILVIVCYYHVTRFRVNLRSIVAWMLRISLLETGTTSEVEWHQRDLNPQHVSLKQTLNHLVKLANWLNGWVFIYELSGCGLESCCCNFRHCYLNIQTLDLFYVGQCFSSASFSLLNALRIRFKKASF